MALVNPETKMALVNAEKTIENTQNPSSQINNESKELLQELKNRTKALMINSKNKIKASLGRNIHLVKEKIEKLKQKNTKPNEASSPKVFITSSSLDFTRYKNDDSKPQAFPMIGACIVLLPYALSGTGVFLGVILILSILIMASFSELLLIQCSLLADEICLPKIGRNIQGTCGCITLFLISLFYSMSVILVYNVIIGDILTKILLKVMQENNIGIISAKNVTILVMVLIVAPLSLVCNIKRITKLSLVSIATSTCLIILLSIKLFTTKDHILQTISFNSMQNINVLQSIAIITYVILCQHSVRLNYVTISKEKKTCSNQPANMAYSYSLLCTLVGTICGYLTFTKTTQPNVLLNLCDEDVFATITYTCFGCGVLCLYPLECQNIRYLIQQAVVVSKKFRNFFNLTITFAVLLPTLILAQFVDCVSSVVELSGFFLAVPLIFILPTVLFIRLSSAPLWSTKKLPCLLSIAIGITITITGSGVEIMQVRKCIRESKMFPYCNGSTELLGPLITLSALNGTIETQINNTLFMEANL
ncbi:putative sodium-coupled neutral amino acid transporter 11 [Hydra vulgaris]|uniref:putative sodium-coupled neutral amino acid transporter 11 n=1 Tax=Hydra vulgaris TaxID=6087 RepID=UPI001F5F7BCF|nr:putative sodium-coupled neutral amino acid transporter 11 [Hydra vulgaris]